uniref:NADH-ubiquinone oxidoreductase chain 6 n=1 Tax=Trioceros melleri TaxID=179915 RepID=D6RS08_TRIMD|nr:NADH dehydrogenase subunit 6 [Trioceros melleri]BAJ08097.1 NADH dehydrogenase subunit 6 [Trioceros melleri]
MYFFFMFWLFIFFMGGVASNPSAYFGSASLVLGSVLGAGILAGLGNTFVSLVLMLVYLGGMLVVFIYSVAASSDVYPEAWGNRSVVMYIVGFIFYLFCLWKYVGGGLLFDGVMFVGEVNTAVDVDVDVNIDISGVILLYSLGGVGFLMLGVALLLTLFVVLYLVYDWSLGAIRAS